MLKSIPENGIAWFAGEIDKGTEIFELIPPQPIQDFIYRCDKQFHIEEIIELFKKVDETKDYGLIMISGDESLFYRLNGAKYNLVCKINTSLQKRQKKGGQSQARIARLGEQKRAIYTKQISEAINSHFIDVKGIILAGPGELKDWVNESSNLDYRIKPKIVKIIAYPDLNVDKFVKQHLSDIVCNDNAKEEKKILSKISKLLNTNSSNVVYGKDEIVKNIDNIKQLIVYKDYEEEWNMVKNEKMILVSRYLPEAQLVKDFGGAIGILYFASKDEFNE
jgi:peptide chain release factor subunit 1